jgi:hypothetical protein
MSYGKMPPQAYTKETLQEAFEWWSEQPDELRNQIQDKDDLVGYYLKVNRGSDSSNQSGFTKSAKESFSSELKGLAKNLDAFEGYDRETAAKNEQRNAQVQNHQNASHAASSYVAERAHNSHHHTPKASGVRHKQVFEPSIQLQFPEMSKPLVPSSEEVNSALNLGPGGSMVSQGTKSQQFFKLDEKSKASVAQVRSLLNLSSDEEALRAIIALGISKVKSLF